MEKKMITAERAREIETALKDLGFSTERMGALIIVSW